MVTVEVQELVCGGGERMSGERMSGERMCGGWVGGGSGGRA